MQAADPFPTYAIVVIAAFWLVVFPLFFSGIVLLISRMSGWNVLATTYPGTRPFTGESFHAASVRMKSFTNYKNVVSVGVDATGLSLDVMFLFRPGHKPIYIPWTDLQGEHGGRFLLWEVTKLRASKAPSVPIRIFSRPETAARLAAFAAAGSGRPFGTPSPD